MKDRATQQAARENTGKRWLKAELHSHCSMDPVDYKICHQTPEQLIEKAACLGYDVLAITCHDLDIWNLPLADYAKEHGITLIPAMEVSTEGIRHTLVYNFRAEAEEINTIAKIRDRRREDTLVVAAHPYFPSRKCLGKLVEENIDVFDAIENSSFYVPGLDFNRKARRVAGIHEKPMVGNGDVHLLWQLGRTFSWIYAEQNVVDVLSAVKKGLVRVETRPIAYWDVPRFWGTALLRSWFPARLAPTLSPYEWTTAE